MLFISQTNILAKSLGKRPDMTMKTPFILILITPRRILSLLCLEGASEF